MPRSLFFEPHSLLFARRSPGFAPFELGGVRREKLFKRRTGEGMPHEGLFVSLEGELASHCLGFGRLDAQGTTCEEDGMRLSGQGTRREEVFAGHEVPFRWEEDGGRRLAGFVARRPVPALTDNGWSRRDPERSSPW